MFSLERMLMLKKLLAFVMAVSCVFALTSCVADYRAPQNGSRTTADLSYILVFEGERVGLEAFINHTAFQVFMVEASFGAEVWTLLDDLFTEVKIRALNRLIETKTIEFNATRIGVSLTETDRAEARAAAEEQQAEFYEEFGINVPISVLVMMAEDDMLLQRIIDDVNDNIDDDPRFEWYFERYLQIFRDFLATIHTHFVLTDNFENAVQAKERFEAGEDALVIVQELSLAYNPEIPFDRTNIWHLPLTADRYADELASIFELAQMEVSEIIEVDGLYLVVRVDEIIEL